MYFIMSNEYVPFCENGTVHKKRQTGARVLDRLSSFNAIRVLASKETG